MTEDLTLTLIDGKDKISASINWDGCERSQELAHLVAQVACAWLEADHQVQAFMEDLQADMNLRYPRKDEDDDAT